MKYTLTHARALLNARELDIFDGARAEALKGWSPAELDSRIRKARDLRDKYRDLYQRQTVATRAQAPSRRRHTGGENDRTESKALLFAQVLERLEARRQTLAARPAERPSTTARHHNAPGAPTTRTNPKQAQRDRRTEGPARPTDGAALPMRGASAVKKRVLQRVDRAATAIADATVAQRSSRTAKAAAKPAAAKPSVAPARPTRAQSPRSVSTAASIKTDSPASPAAAGAGKAAAPRQTATAASSSSRRASKATPKTPLLEAVSAALDQKKARRAAAPATGRSGKGRARSLPVRDKVSAAVQGGAPTDVPAVAERLDPLKAAPRNQKIHASARGRKKVFQAKRDSRSQR